MEIKEKRDGAMPFLEIKGITHFDVEKTFDCGQCFRFDKVNGSRHGAEYAGVAFGRHVSFASEGDTLYVYNSDEQTFESVWRHFLALDMDYRAIDRDIVSRAKSPVMDEACKHGRGIRILKQDAYEAVISFIISQNNNIPRIKKIIEALCKSSGQPIEIPEEAKKHVSGVSSLYSFPTSDALLALGEQGLFDLKTGFRAKYIYDAAVKLTDGTVSLSDIEGMESTDECINALCAVKGIGVKVASCAALFGMAKYDAFPIDVWMKRVAQKYFSDSDEEFSPSRFGSYAGIAQQYLFYYERYLGGEK